jgi:O-antigen ligase
MGLLICFGIIAMVGISEEGLGRSNPITAAKGRVISIWGYKDDVSAQHRFGEWQAALKSIESHPFLGNGLGFKILFQSPMQLGGKDKIDYSSSDYYMHNSYLWFMTKMGLIGFGLFFTSVFLILKKGAMAISLSTNDKDIATSISLFACLVAVAVISLFGPMFNIISMTPFIMILIGGITICYRNNLTIRESKINDVTLPQFGSEAQSNFGNSKILPIP